MDNIKQKVIISEIDLAWIAGLLDGEGCFTKKSKRGRTIMICCQMTDMDVLEKLKEKMGCGRIHGP